MKGIFSYDGFLGQLVNKSLDAVCLSFLWLVFSLPLFTMGAASTALYYTWHKVIRQEEGHLFRAFWHSFKSNFKQVTPAWLVFLAFYIIFPVNGYFAYAFYATDVMPLGLLIVIGVFAAVVMMHACWLLPYIARFQDTTKVAGKNCIYMMIMHFPVSVGLLVIFIGSVLLAVGVPLGIAFAPAVCAWLSNLILEPVFRKYMSPEDKLLEGIEVLAQTEMEE